MCVLENLKESRIKSVQNHRLEAGSMKMKKKPKFAKGWVTRNSNNINVKTYDTYLAKGLVTLIAIVIMEVVVVINIWTDFCNIECAFTYIVTSSCILTAGF